MRRLFRTLFYLGIMALAAGFFWYRFEMKTAIPGEIEKDTRAFHGISVGGAFEIKLHKGSNYDIQIHAENEKWLSNIRTEVKNGILHVKYDGKGWSMMHGGMRLDVTAPDIRWISLSGTADLETVDPIRGDELFVKVSGAGDLDIDAYVGVFTGQLSGTGNMDLEGTAEDANFKISGVGNIDAFNFKAASVTAKISGTGNAEVYATESLSAKISGAGNISYKGHPSSVHSDVSGAGSINER